MGAKPLRIRFDKANGIPNIYNGIRSLELNGVINVVLIINLQESDFI